MASIEKLSKSFEILKIPAQLYEFEQRYKFEKINRKTINLIKLKK
jgi:hypothetical protein